MEREELENEIKDILIKWDSGNFTVCSECCVDDFIHEESCKFAKDNLITRLADFIEKNNENSLILKGGYKIMGQTLLTTNIPRKTGFLYYCSTDKKTGCVTVCEAQMARGGKSKKKSKK